MKLQPVKYKAFCQQCGEPGKRSRATHALCFSGYTEKAALYLCPECLEKLAEQTALYTRPRVFSS